ncbi:MAG: hypothetical protein ACUVWR_14620 [Anaerolineae bacterium]
MGTGTLNPALQPAWHSWLVGRINAGFRSLSRHWLLAFNLTLGLWVGLPWLAPVFMHWGWAGPAKALYWLYGLFCHQMGQRSWFLFGSSFSPTLAAINRVSGSGNNMAALRYFIGNAEMGWKLAWSDRMVSFYGSWFLFGLLHAALRNRRHGLHWRTAILLVLPMALDGITHMVSDLWGIGNGFRDSNAWLIALTGKALPATFYAGDAWGSFNSLVRLVTGPPAAFGIIFWLLPELDRLTGRQSH